LPPTNDISENDLVNRCLANDRKAQQLLFEKYKKAMFTKIFRLLNDYDEANDALQEGFIEVFKNLKNFRFDATLGAWIKTIMVRQAIRRQVILSKFERFDVQIHEVAFEVSDSFSAQELDEAIRGLPEGCRTVFLLAEVEGYMHKEIAEMLQISEGTSKSQLSHAKKLLRKKLTDA
jgi:RNA polymerase sigma factor (sigma-70 family)